MTTFKKHLVVMIAVDETSDLFLDYKNKIIYDNGHKNTNLKWKDCIYQNIYILSDEEIKDNDYITDGIKVIRAIPKIINSQGLVNKRNWKKIIATTDTSLQLPNLPTQFIEQYITAYNNGKPITEVMVEYELLCTNCGESNCDKLQCRDNKDVYYLLINPDNTINTKSIKESWSREEVIKLISNFANSEDNLDLYDGYYRGCQNEAVNNWIKSNL